MIHIELEPEIEHRLQAQADSCGVTFSDYVRELLERQAKGAAATAARDSVGDTIEHIRELRKGNKLAGLKLKNLIHEGHQY